MERALRLDPNAADSTESADGQLVLLSRFVARLIEELERKPRRLQRAQVLRIAKYGAALLTVVAVLLLAKGWFSRDLARTAKYTTSSSAFDCTKAECGDAFFHTQEEDSPWIEYDLGQPQTVRRVEVRNRWDCCYERAVPLVVETSVDRRNWTLAGRMDQPFFSWSADVKQQARYVRLRVDARSTLHLRRVSIF